MRDCCLHNTSRIVTNTMDVNNLERGGGSNWRCQSRTFTLHWRHNGHGGVSNHQPRGCILNSLFRRRWQKTSKLHVTGLCAGQFTGTGEFPAQRASNAENVSIWWSHHENWAMGISLFSSNSQRLFLNQLNCAKNNHFNGCQQYPKSDLFNTLQQEMQLIVLDNANLMDSFATEMLSNNSGKLSQKWMYGKPKGNNHGYPRLIVDIKKINYRPHNSTVVFVIQYP